VVVPSPDVAQFKGHKEDKAFFDEEGVNVFILKNCWSIFLSRNLSPAKRFSKSY